jgi:hypothetical protein
MQLVTHNYRLRLKEKRESRARGRLWGRGYGFLQAIRAEEAVKLDAVYSGFLGDKVMRGNPEQ